METKPLQRKCWNPYPEIVQKWVSRSGAVNKKLISTVSLRQKGMMRSKAGGNC
ncbi:DUF6544 family protein [Daejeonella lutea]|uniref:DUF6544 family protein n=1 Tax=Daejeonella lutea TaxID=572036 RepID=UPI003899019E